MQHLAEPFNLLPNLLGDIFDTQSLLLFAVATAKDSTISDARESPLCPEQNRAYTSPEPKL